MIRTLIIACIYLLPLSVYGAVSIHEVAWMGDAASANHEWIELYNSGDAAVSVDGWTLTDGMNLAVSLVGTLLGGQYAVLERSNDESAPGTAFLIYTGALVNTGATLQLKDAHNGIVDQVAGGENWQNIGGDNVTKETAQYTTGGWVTAPGTPGRSNATAAATTTQATEAKKTVSSGDWLVGEVRAPVVLSRTPETDLVLTPAVPERAFVGQKVSFSVQASGVGEQFKASLNYVWNFGDTATGTGKSVTHKYAYPGTYMVRVRGSFGTREAVSEAVVTVLPITVSLTRNEDEDIQLHNDTVYPVDVSGYHVRGDKVVIIPTDTIILPRSTVTIPSHRVELVPGQSLVMVYDTGGEPVAWTEPFAPTLASSRPYEVSDITLDPDISYPLLSEFVTVPATESQVFPVPSEEAVSKQIEDDEGDRYNEEVESRAVEVSKTWEIGLLFLCFGVIVLIWSFPKRSGPETVDL
jgi:hypothetical protein